MQGNITLSPTIPYTEFIGLIKEAVKEALADNAQEVPEDTILNSNEVMKLCRISHVTLSHWRQNGKIPFTQIGKKIIYKKSEVMKVLSNSLTHE